MKYKIIRAINNLTLSDNTLVMDQKLTLRYYLSSGLLARFYLKKKEKRTIYDINEITEIRFIKNLLSGNLIIIKTHDYTYNLAMSNGKSLNDCANYLRNSKLSKFIIEK